MIAPAYNSNLPRLRRRPSARHLLSRVVGNEGIVTFARVGETVSPLIGKSPAMREVFERILRAAEVESPVLIWGERGAGKRQVAEAIHRRSHRAARPFVVVSTERIPSDVVEQEIFGRGSPAGLLNGERRGLAHDAPGGTLLIEEIRGLPRTGQARLLRAIEGQSGMIRGGHDETWPDVRWMVSTRYDPLDSVERGAMREDLYYRLAVVAIRVPSLRERKEDVPRLVRQLLAELCDARRVPVPSVEPELMHRLVEHPWSGNLDELRDCVERIFAASPAGPLGADLLPPSFEASVEPWADPRRETARDATLAELERTAVARALTTHEGNRAQVAKTLGISVRTLQRKLKQWGM